MEIISRGAEAVIGLEDGKITKERVRKSYRIAELDGMIRKQRTSMEASLLDKARRAGINVPLVLGQEGSTLKLEHIGGEKLKGVLNKMGKKEVEDLSWKIGDAIGRLHSAGIIHGDLTTSNFILKGDNLHFLDFGLGKNSSRIEDQATDLYLLHEALNSTHSKILDVCWKNIIEGYMKVFENSAAVLKRLDQISKRRRYKTES